MLEKTLLELQHYFKVCKSQQYAGKDRSLDKDKLMLEACYYGLNKIQKNIGANLIIMPRLIKMPFKSTKLKQKIQPFVQIQQNQLQKQNHYRIMITAKQQIQRLLNTTNSDKLYKNCINSQKKEQNNSKNKFKIRAKKKYFQQGNHLQKDQRYCQNSLVKLSPQKISKLGLYQSANIFKSKNIINFSKQLTLIGIASKPLDLKLCSPKQMFLTNINVQIIPPTPLPLPTPIQQDQVFQSIQQIVQVAQPPLQIESIFHLTIKNYKVETDEAYYELKSNKMEQWGQTMLYLSKIIDFLRSVKITFFRVRTDKLMQLWGGRNIYHSHLAKLLRVKPLLRPQQVIQSQCLGFIEKGRVRIMRQNMRRQQVLTNWVGLRVLTKYRIKSSRQRKKALALEMHRNLTIYSQWEVQIHIPSLSVGAFQRTTTQYMESLQTKFLGLWRDEAKQIILVLPVVNQQLIKYFKSKFSLRRNITIICPDLHSTYPRALSLAACLYFSYDALTRIKTLIQNKRCVIVPGTYDDPNYELLISQWLNVPLMTSLSLNLLHCAQKRFFSQAGVENPLHKIIPPNSPPQCILQNLSHLIANSKQQTRYLFKLNKQFGGRGFAAFQTADLKTHKRNNVDLTNKEEVCKLLKSALKLRLKVNFQNSLFMVDEYLSAMGQSGGVIEEYIPNLCTYEVCYNKSCKCVYVSAFRVYQVDYSSKVWVSTSSLSEELLEAIEQIRQQLAVQECVGLISVFLGLDDRGHVYGIDIKPYETHASGLCAVISVLESECMLNEFNNQYNVYMLLPNILFTDVEDEAKSKLIDSLMEECWHARQTHLQGECRLYFSLGLTLHVLLVGKDIKKIKKLAVETVRELTERSSGLKEYKGKEEIRDVFQFADIIRAITQIKQEEEK